MTIQNRYDDGNPATVGVNTIRHFYDRAGIKAANRVNVFQQFADKKQMPKKHGKTFKISKFLHMYDRAPNDPAFGGKGYLSSRSVDEVSASLDAAGLAEGAGAVNKRSIRKITVETNLARYGEMLDYTDEVELFSEDAMQVRYREELGELAGSRHEDLIMMDMLSTPTVMYVGPATSEATIGAEVALNGDDDGNFKVSYDLIRKATRKLLRNRAKKNTTLISGSTKIDTRTCAAAYYAIIGAEVKADLEVLTRGAGTEKEFAYIPAHKYAAAGNLAEGEVGAMHEVRFIEAEGMAVYAGYGAPVPAGYDGTLAFDEKADETWVQNTGTTAADLTGVVTGNPYGTSLAAGEMLQIDEADVTAITGVANVVKLDGRFNVYPILFPTQGAFATVGLKGQDKIKFYSKAPSDVSVVNPYGTQGFFSYNFFYAGLILEEEKLLKVLVGASA